MYIAFNTKLIKKKFDRQRRSQRLRSTTKNSNDNLLKRILNKNTNEQASTIMKIKDA